MGHGVSKVSGVVVDGNEKVVVKRKQLKKVPMQYLKESLKSFNMSHNAILTIPPQISTLQNLTELNMSHNWLNNKGIPQELNALRCLSSLDLSHNNLTTFPDIFSLTTLHTLNLSNNGITSLPAEITKLVNLQSFNIKFNKVDSIPDLDSVPSLFILDLSHNQIKVLPKSLKRMTTLRLLNLSHNYISRAPSFRQLTNLVHLDIHNNKIAKLSNKMAQLVDSNTTKNYEGGIVTMGRLRELNVRDNKDLVDIPHDLVALMKPPLLLQTSIPAEVVPKVFLGGLDSATNMALLQHLRITHIILAIGSMQPHFPKSFSYLALYDAKDSANFDFSIYFDECAQFIESARAGGGGVLIHCRAGISRSPTLVIAYLMKMHRMRYEQALKLVLAKRSQALPNNGFREQLMQYEVKLFDMDIESANNFGNVSLDFVTTEDDGGGGDEAVNVD